MQFLGPTCILEDTSPTRGLAHTDRTSDSMLQYKLSNSSYSLDKPSDFTQKATFFKTYLFLVPTYSFMAYNTWEYHKVGAQIFTFPSLMTSHITEVHLTISFKTRLFLDKVKAIHHCKGPNGLPKTRQDLELHSSLQLQQGKMCFKSKDYCPTQF